MKRYCVDGSSIATSLTSFDDTSRFEESSDMTGRYSIRSNTNANSLSSPLSLLSSSSDQTVPDNYGCTSTAAKSMYKDNHQGPHVDVEVMGMPSREQNRKIFAQEYNTRCHTKSSTHPIRCPRSESEDFHLVSTSQQTGSDWTYNQATWRMYHRIVNFKKSRRNLVTRPISLNASCFLKSDQMNHNLNDLNQHNEECANVNDISFMEVEEFGEDEGIFDLEI